MIPAKLSDLSGLPVLGRCEPPCTERLWALVNNDFGPARVLGGWVFREGPYRHMSDDAKWTVRYFGEKEPEDHTGNPYTFTQCPWCGRDLPEPPDDEGLESDD